MTIQDAGKRYQIPPDILEEYQRWGLCNGQCGDRDIPALSMLMTLHDIGFSPAEAETYMHLSLEGESGDAQRLQMLEHRRSRMLEEIHGREAQLSRLDFLRHQLKNKMTERVRLDEDRGASGI